MTLIKKGYDSQPLEIKVSASDGKAEIWTEMFDFWKYSETRTGDYPKDDERYRTELLHYATLQELIELRNELNGVIKTIAGV